MEADEGPVGVALNDAWFPMAMLDADARFSGVNQAFCELVGHRAEDLVGHLASEVFEAQLIAPEVEAFEGLLASGNNVVRYPRSFSAANGQLWTGEALVSVARGDQGQLEVIHVRFTEEGLRRPPARLAWLESDFPLALDSMRVGVAIIGIDGAALQVNRALCELTGHTEEELKRIDMLQMTHPDDREADVELGTRAWLGEIDTYTIEKRLIRPDGSIVWVLQELTMVRDNGQLLHIVAQVIDITDRKVVELELARNRHDLATFIDTMPVGLMSSDASGMIRTANPAASAIAGVTLGAGFDVSSLIHRHDLARIVPVIRRHVAARSNFHVEFRVVRPDGEVRWVRNDAHPDLAEDGTYLGMTGTWLDVTDLKAAEALLHHQANSDPLTGLANRWAAFADLDEHVAANEAFKADGLAVLFVDLDGFKAVNDHNGHGIGDALLAATASRLAALAGPDEQVSRIGGDEFIVRTTSGFEGAEQLAERIIATVARPFDLGGRELVIGASVGIAHWRRGDDSDHLVQAADRAVYEAKASGRSCWRLAV